MLAANMHANGRAIELKRFSSFCVYTYIRLCVQNA